MSVYKLLTSTLQMKSSSVFLLILLQSLIITFYVVRIYDDGYYNLCHVFSGLQKCAHARTHTNTHTHTHKGGGEFLLSLWISLLPLYFFFIVKSLMHIFKSLCSIKDIPVLKLMSAVWLNPYMAWKLQPLLFLLFVYLHENGNVSSWFCYVSYTK